MIKGNLIFKDEGDWEPFKKNLSKKIKKRMVTKRIKNVAFIVLFLSMFIFFRGEKNTQKSYLVAKIPSRNCETLITESGSVIQKSDINFVVKMGNER